MVYIPIVSTRNKMQSKRLTGGNSTEHNGDSGHKLSSESSPTASNVTNSSAPATSDTPSEFLIETQTGVKLASIYTDGGAPREMIPSGPYADRYQGGAVRSQVYGTKIYGSGYTYERKLEFGVAGTGFPYFFWPVVWGPDRGYGPFYVHTNEFGAPNDSERPGGQLMWMAVQGPGDNADTYNVVADRDTIDVLMGTLDSTCPSIANKPLKAIEFNGTDDEPQPESVVQYYRSSSVVLTLNGYNDSAVSTTDPIFATSSMASMVDQTFLQCLNHTIGETVPLVAAVTDDGSTLQVNVIFLLLASILVMLRNL